MRPAYWVALAAVAGAVAYVAWKGTRGTAQAVGGAVFDMVDGAASGAVVAIGKTFGLPETDLTECERAKAEGRTWDASFACPAGNFLNYLFN